MVQVKKIARDSPFKIKRSVDLMNFTHHSPTELVRIVEYIESVPLVFPLRRTSPPFVCSR